MLAVRNIPKSGRTADDVLAYVHLSVAEIVQAAKTLTRQPAGALLTMSGLRVLCWSLSDLSSAIPKSERGEMKWSSTLRKLKL